MACSSSRSCRSCRCTLDSLVLALALAETVTVTGSSSSSDSVRVGIDARGECVGVERRGGNGTVNVGPGLAGLPLFTFANGNVGTDSDGSGGNGANVGKGSGGGGIDSVEYEGSGASVCLRTPLIRAVVGLRHPSVTLVRSTLLVADGLPFAFEEVERLEFALELELELMLEEGVSPKTRSSRAHSFAADSCAHCEFTSVEQCEAE